MDNILIIIITAAVMIGSAINAANKKKKETARKAFSRPDSEPNKELKHKSLSEIIRELDERSGEPGWLSEQEPEPEIEPESEYYGMGADSLEERAMTEARPEAMTYRSAEKNPASYLSHITEAAEAEVAQSIAIQEKEPETLDDILGGGFNLKRAIIESEILKPKYEQY